MQVNKIPAILEIDGDPQVLSSIFAIRWVDCENSEPHPVLYKNGKRVVKSWRISLYFESPPDEFGGNANTD